LPLSNATGLTGEADQQHVKVSHRLLFVHQNMAGQYPRAGAMAGPTNVPHQIYFLTPRRNPPPLLRRRKRGPYKTFTPTGRERLMRAGQKNWRNHGQRFGPLPVRPSRSNAARVQGALSLARDHCSWTRGVGGADVFQTDMAESPIIAFSNTDYSGKPAEPVGLLTRRAVTENTPFLLHARKRRAAGE